ncbi:two-component system response regulator CpxR [Orbus hercynius]|uniref:Two-component system response regulator CpxR n=1 Tax=Orbus hercynius TaxID=593135 RepID=A0A495REI4_9GAMM|nr:response regulator [Orbus hercynius]RKS85720.1 two-component system response regulator CpxR [Orbus hercynius]
MNKKLLLVDDDLEITALLKELLELEGFTVEIAYNGAEALTKFNHSIDLVLLDIMMPDTNGLSVLTQLRAKYTVPVILLTAKDNDLDKIIGLELGADDYIIKPFNDRELVARIRATLRRRHWDSSSSQQDDAAPAEYQVDGLKVNVRQQAVYFDSKYIELTGTEFQILLKLLEQPGNIISRDMLSESVLGKEFLPFARSIDVHVSNLRKKLPPRKDGLPWIKTLRSKGYLFVIDKDFG